MVVSRISRLDGSKTQTKSQGDLISEQKVPSRPPSIPLRPTYPFCHLSQNTRFNIPQTPNLQTSPYPNFSLSRRKVYQPGRSNQSLKPSTPCWSTRGQR